MSRLHLAIRHSFLNVMEHNPRIGERYLLKVFMIAHSRIW